MKKKKIILYLFQVSGLTCMFLHYQSHVANQAVASADQEGYRGAPQNSAKPQTCPINKDR